MRQRGRAWVLVVLGAVVGLALAVGGHWRGEAIAQQNGGGDCSAAIGPPTVVNGRGVGPEVCVIGEERSIENASGAPYQRLEIALDGTLAGYAVLAGPRREMFTDVPEFALAQRDNNAPRQPGVARYTGVKGTGMTVFLPASPRDWNGMLYVSAHGAGSWAPVGELVPRQAGQFNPLTGANAYVGPMIDKGYAVAYTRRASSQGPDDDEHALLDDGTDVGGLSFSYHTGLLRDFAQLARNLVVERLGREPERSYFYGHSAGGSLGRLLNYVPGANRDAAGSPLFAGFVIDDAGGGYYLPRLMVDGRDVLFATAAERAAFAPQLEVAHQLYTGETGDYLLLKRENAWIVQNKGLGDRFRMYEVAGSTHFDAGAVSRASGAEGALAPQNVDLGGIFDAAIDGLDAWVARGIAPWPTRSDSYLLGDLDRDGVRESPAVQLPETACPTGAYYVFPESLGFTRRGTQVTAFAAYDGAGEEPLDARGYFVDMNHNNTRDRRETLDEAWRRRAAEGETSGILAPGERVTPERYARCVEEAAVELVAQRLLSPAAGAYYAAQARASNVGRGGQ